jgi:protein pelota
LKFTRENELVKVEILGPEDLWYLSLVLKPGDNLVAEVLRRVEKKEDVIRNKKTEREKIRVSIRIESVEFMEISSRLHILGQIVEGPEDYLGEHQSINVEPSSTIILVPSDLGSFIRKIEESSSLSSSTLFILSTDDQNISFYGINESNNDLLWRIPVGSGKMYGGKEISYMDDFLQKMEKYRQSEIYVIGPSIFRDSTSKMLAQNNFKSINTQVSESEEYGIRELLQEGTLNLRRSAEAKLVTDFLKGVNSGLSSYGKSSVEHSLDVRAVSILLMSDKFFRGAGSAPLMEKCSQGGCKLFVVHSSWETGKIINSYGGVVALLRYKTYDLSSTRK